jgi:hypothetical protein
MRRMIGMMFLLSGIVLFAGCGGSDKPKAPEGYVDPGTDPAAMSKEMTPTPGGTPKK